MNYEKQEVTLAIKEKDSEIKQHLKMIANLQIAIKEKEGKTNDEKISEGICLSDRNVDHCPRCVDKDEEIKKLKVRIEELDMYLMEYRERG